MRGKAKKRILVVVAEMGHNTQREIAGISQCAKKTGWFVDVVEGRHFGERPDFAKWIDIWRPSGLVVDRQYYRQALACREARRIPMVIWDLRPTEALPRLCVAAASDPMALADAAARELARTDFPRFAFVNAFGAPKWSRERGDAFLNAVASMGHPATAFTPPAADAADAARFRNALTRFLRGLETPCGIFAANDQTSAHVASLCMSLGISIPNDIALIGVDDSLEYCEQNEPTLSSVRIDLEGGGAAATAAIVELAESGSRHGRANGRFVRYGVESVVRRASTRTLRIPSGIVIRALEWIRKNACRPIVAADVVAAIGCSRRLADLRFRQATGHTILDEIHSRRLEEAMSLLKRSDVPIEEIPERCGYQRGTHLGFLFKRATGMSMRQWRSQAKNREWGNDN